MRCLTRTPSSRPVLSWVFHVAVKTAIRFATGESQDVLGCKGQGRELQQFAIQLGHGYSEAVLRQTG